MVDLIFRNGGVLLTNDAAFPPSQPPLRVNVRESMQLTSVYIPEVAHMQLKSGRVTWRVNIDVTQIYPIGNKWAIPDTGQLFPRSQVRRR